MNHTWINDGYEEWLKSQKKSHSQKRFKFYIKRRFALEGVDIDQVDSAPAQFFELFAECFQLRQWLRAAFLALRAINADMLKRTTKNKFKDTI